MQQTSVARPVPAPSPLKRFWREYGWAYAFIAVPVLLFLVFTLYPVISAFIMSFQEYGILQSKWVGGSNYSRLVHDEVFWKSMKNTVIFTVGTVPVNIVITFGLAYLIFQTKNKWQTFFQSSALFADGRLRRHAVACLAGDVRPDLGRLVQ